MKSRDYEEFIELLNQNGVRYLIIGAHAVAFHARPRATKDLDLLIDPTRENAERILESIREFLGTDLGLTLEDLSTLGRIVQLGVAPSRIDLLARIPGIAGFQAAWERGVTAEFGSVPARFLGLDDLIAAKASTGRDQDKVDLRVLKQIAKRR